jgi:hypothetical protein
MNAVNIGPRKQGIKICDIADRTGSEQAVIVTPC